MAVFKLCLKEKCYYVPGVGQYCYVVVPEIGIPARTPLIYDARYMSLAQLLILFPSALDSLSDPFVLQLFQGQGREAMYNV